MNEHAPTRRWLLLACALVIPLAAHAAGEHPGLCPLASAPPPTLPPGPTDGLTHVSGDRLRSQPQGVTTATGNVVVRRGDKQITGERAKYSAQKDTVDVTGNVRLLTPALSASGTRARYNLSDNSGEVWDTYYHLFQSRAFGKAARIRLLDPKHAELKQATYSTCPPQRRDWELKAGELDLDDATNTGEAYNTTVYFKGVPFLYLPYLNFPLHGRKSGFLAPTFGSSQKNGADLSVPYYWNIAPNRDATFTPRYIGKRGTMISGQFRFLNPHSAGTVEADYLPHDRIFGHERHHVAVDAHAALGEGWNSQLVYNDVSDPYFFNDLGNSQADAAATHLERRVDLDYTGAGWSFLGRLQSFQTLSGADTYARLPQLLLNAATPQIAGQPHYSLRGEYVDFQKPGNAPTGRRLDLTPAVSLPLQGTAWFLTPRLAARLTQYDLKDAPDNNASRALPVASLDGGLYFDRNLHLAGRDLTQTLEPRLYYLYVPYTDQSNLPLFDTSLNSLSLPQMFSTNRFSGADRVGDANQITGALTTRFIDNDSGDQLASASIGQIYYFAHRKVTLTGSPDTRPTSDVVGELTANPDPAWQVSATTQWNPHTGRTEATTTQVRYSPGNRRVLNLSYHYLRNSVRQTDIAALWPLGRQWHALARWNYDLLTNSTLDTIFGVEYRSCCWAVQLVAQGRMDTVTHQIDRSFYLTLELTGLSRIGRNLDSQVGRGILGFN